MFLEVLGWERSFFYLLKLDLALKLVFKKFENLSLTLKTSGNYMFKCSKISPVWSFTPNFFLMKLTPGRDRFPSS